jgi:hypothetical protein
VLLGFALAIRAEKACSATAAWLSLGGPAPAPEASLRVLGGHAFSGLLHRAEGRLFSPGGSGAPLLLSAPDLLAAEQVAPPPPPRPAPPRCIMMTSPPRPAPPHCTSRHADPPSPPAAEQQRLGTEAACFDVVHLSLPMVLEALLKAEGGAAQRVRVLYGWGPLEEGKGEAERVGEGGGEGAGRRVLELPPAAELAALLGPLLPKVRAALGDCGSKGGGARRR